MHGIHPQVVPHRLTGFTASRLDPSQATAGVCDGQTVPHFLSFEVGRFGHCATSFVEIVVLRGLKWLSTARLGTGGW